MKTDKAAIKTIVSKMLKNTFEIANVINSVLVGIKNYRKTDKIKIN